MYSEKNMISRQLLLTVSIIAAPAFCFSAAHKASDDEKPEPCTSRWHSCAGEFKNPEPNFSSYCIPEKSHEDLKSIVYRRAEFNKATPEEQFVCAQEIIDGLHTKHEKNAGHFIFAWWAVYTRQLKLSQITLPALAKARLLRFFYRLYKFSSKLCDFCA